MDRADVEDDLVFMAFLVFENRIKPATPDSLDELRDAHIRMIMCTGDNALTAVSVARNCHLIATNTRVFVPTLLPIDGYQSNSSAYSEKPQNLISINSSGPLARIRWSESTGSNIGLDPATLEPFATDPSDVSSIQMARKLAHSGQYCIAVTGDVFTYIRDSTADSAAGLDECWKQMLMRGAVYARMSPELKAELVCNLQTLGYITCFCGDGANDCAALKTADVGISLSEAEASVAAPFTSHSMDISCVSELLKEGRCSIATSFGCFKYMALYSMIQFTSCCLLYVYNVNLSDGQYLFVDLFTILPVAICMDRSKSYSRLIPKRPSASLTSKKVLTSLIGNVVLVIVFQVALFFITESQPWYQKPVPDNPADPDSVPNKCDLSTSIFLFSIFQYLFTGAIFNIGPPYRQSALRNYEYMAVIVLLLLFDLWVLLVPVSGFLSLFGLVHVKVGWRFVILGLSAANFALCYLGEQFVFPLLAIPLAKMFRMARWGFAGLVARLRGYEAPPLCERHEQDIDRNEIGRAAPNVGLWARLGHRSNRKEYKLLLEKMAGGPSWY
ncbi:hypothetical protein LPJ53_001933 [Coemansia erecta]|uniref:HAD-like protein n=1 Tax=Coemansia erecta TaxID=147472 RepID=A0A9W7Y5C8_9FUNG|nr:hypothetical protein LPJ53_001933 [Coemansia erecta]